MSKDLRIDAYIKRSAPFARPILVHIRTLVHTACPEVEEKIKWSFPHFDYKAKMMCSMAAFTQHAVFGFWYGARMKDPHKVMERTGKNTAMGHFGRIRAVSDLPRKAILVSYVKEAMKLNEVAGPAVSKGRRRTKPAAKPVRPPSTFLAALKKHPKAKRAYDGFPPGQKREYVSWITEAKTLETRERRLKQAIEWISEGKYRNWKYMR